jgi:hypothetical protein
MGLAVRVSTSTPSDRALIDSLWRYPEALLLVHHQQPELLEGDVHAQQPVGAHHHVDRTVGQPGQHLLGLGVGEEPAQHSTFTGNGAYRSAKVWACWLASRVVGTSTATW